MKRVRRGSIVIEQENTMGNIKIYTSHTPSNAISVEKADHDDLLAALVEMISPSKGAKSN